MGPAHGLRVLPIHALRRSYVSLARQRGASIEVVGRSIGHASPAVYHKICAEDVQPVDLGL